MCILKAITCRELQKSSSLDWKANVVNGTAWGLGLQECVQYMANTYKAETFT